MTVAVSNLKFRKEKRVAEKKIHSEGENSFFPIFLSNI